MGVEPMVDTVMSKEELSSITQAVREIYLPDVVANYIARLVDSTHRGSSKAAESIKYGASPRAALGLASAAKAKALMAGRINTSFEDVADIAIPVLQHRILLEYEARIEGKTAAEIVSALLEEVPRQELDLPTTLKEN